MTHEKKGLKKKSENISDWYNDIVIKSELADYGPAKGTMVIRPYGYALWERVQEVFNVIIKKNGVQNAYFPMLIPMSFLQKEKEHVKGFSPELAVVTIGGGETLKEPLAVRPTSETIMYAMFAKWIHSWRDLPLQINQWSNVVRWEKRTYLFLRTSEFLWQEGHTAHATHEGSIAMTKKALEWYRQIFEDYLAIPVVMGAKSVTERFAGAVTTYCVESLMPDGKALQSATSHDLGQNFSKPFDITFQTKEGTNEHVFQTSWGLSTRVLGGLFLTHGDDDGLILPPKIAPTQVVIIPIRKSDADEELIEYCRSITDELEASGIRAKLDDRDTVMPGRKFNEWEIRGVPVRLEIGEKELREKSVTVVLRDLKDKQTKSFAEFLSGISALLTDMQKRLFDTQVQFLKANTFDVNTYEEFKKVMSTTRGFLRAYWCEDPICEKGIKEDTKATTRCLPLEEKEGTGICVHCGKPANHRWLFAQSY